jgi:hypothetical protein
VRCEEPQRRFNYEYNREGSETGVYFLRQFWVMFSYADLKRYVLHRHVNPSSVSSHILRQPVSDSALGWSDEQRALGSTLLWITANTEASNAH